MKTYILRWGLCNIGDNRTSSVAGSIRMEKSGKEEK